MATYIGYNTQVPATQTSMNSINNSSYKSNKSTRMVDEQLVIQDLINAFNIRKGSIPGLPSYGCGIWDDIFEQNTTSLQASVETEVRNIIAADNRIVLNTVSTNIVTNGIFVTIEFAINKFNTPRTIQIYFDGLSNSAYEA